MSNTPPVLNVLASEQSHNTMPATSSTLPRRFSGLAAIMSSTTLSPKFRIRSVSMGPGATQFTRMLVSQTSRESAFVNAITPALAAEYAARFGRPSFACKGTHVDNPPVSYTPHEREDLPCHFEYPDQVDLKNAFPFRSIEFLERLVAAEIPSIVDKDFDARRLTKDMRDGSYDLVGVCDIDLQGLSTVKFDWIDIPNPDMSARSHELCRNSLANSPSPASYDSGLTRKTV